MISPTPQFPIKPKKVFIKQGGLGRPLGNSFSNMNSNGIADLVFAAIGSGYHILEKRHYPFFIRSGNAYLPVKCERMKDLESQTQLYR